MERDLKRDQRKREILYGIHPIWKIIQSESRTIEKIYVSKRSQGSRIGKLIKAARGKAIPVSFVPMETLKKLAGTDKHQGVVASIASAVYFRKGDIFSSLDESSIVLILDHIEDPGNLGGIIRTAAAMGVSGIFLPAKGSAGLTATTVKRSAGAAEIVKIARVGNLVSLVEELKKKNFCIAAIEKGGITKSYQAAFQFPLCIIMGGEHRGIRKKMREKADMVLEIPMNQKVESLNVSVACGIILYEVMRAFKSRNGDIKDY